MWKGTTGRPALGGRKSIIDDGRPISRRVYFGTSKIIADRGLQCRKNNARQSRLLGEKTVEELVGRKYGTLWDWIVNGTFPKPVILNPGQKRELRSWREDEIQKWIDSRPQRLAKPVSQKTYERFRRSKRLTRPTR